MNLSPLQKTILPGGIRVLTVEIPHAHSVSFGIWFFAGSRDEPEDQPGVAHLTEHLWALDDVGVNALTTSKETKAYTSKEIMLKRSRIPRQAFTDVFPAVVKGILHPNLDIKNFLIQRRRIVRELYENQAKSLLWNSILFEKELWQGHQLSRTTIGEMDFINQAEPETILFFLKEAVFQPQKVVVSVAGNISHEETTRFCGECFSQLDENITARQRVPYQNHQTGPQIINIQTGRKPFIILGFKLFSRSHPDFNTFMLIIDYFNNLLNSSEAANLDMRNSLAQIHSYEETGVVMISVETSDSSVMETVSELIQILKLFKEGKIDLMLFSRVLSYNRDRLIMSYDSTTYISSWYAEQEMYHAIPGNLSDLVAHFDSLSIDECIRVARNIFAPNLATLATIDVKQVREDELLTLLQTI